jgi:hypothetical protein
MGSLGGHLVPGTIFIILGLWWIYSSWLRYFICRQRRRPFYISTAFPLHCCGPRVAKLPMEAFFVMFGTTVGMIIEFIGGYNRILDPETGHVTIVPGANNVQHFSMYFMFFLVGLIELLIHYNFPLPKNLDLVAGGLAFTAEALLFYFHGHTHEMVEMQLHVFLVLAISATVICGVFEMVLHEKEVYATLMRGFFTVLQGSWFYTVGFLLYSPFHEHYSESKDPDSMRTLMLVAFYFALQMAIILSLLLILSVPAYLVSKRQQQSIDFTEYGHLTMDNNDDEEIEKVNGTTHV